MFSVRTAIMNKKLSLTHLFAFRRLPVFGSNYLINFNQRYYHENVIDHFEKPRNVGAMNPKDKNVGTGLVGAPACGDVMKLQIKVNEATNKIEKAVFKVSSYWLNNHILFTKLNVFRLLGEEVLLQARHMQLKFFMEWILMRQWISKTKVIS